MTKILWEDPDLDTKVLGVLRECGAVNEGGAMAPHTVFRRLKTDAVILGITRVKEALGRLVESRQAKKTSGRKPRYYLRRG